MHYRFKFRLGRRKTSLQAGDIITERRNTRGHLDFRRDDKELSIVWDDGKREEGFLRVPESAGEFCVELIAATLGLMAKELSYDDEGQTWMLQRR